MTLLNENCSVLLVKGLRILEGRRETYATYACVRAKSLQSCPTLCYSLEHSPPGSSVLGILQARILEWVAMPSSRGSSRPRDRTRVLMSPTLTGGFFTTSATWKACMHVSIQHILTELQLYAQPCSKGQELYSRKQI